MLVGIDIDRMQDGKVVEKRIRQGKGGGIPWFAFMAGDGRILQTSDGPKGNIGCPYEPHEIDHFLAMLKAVARRLTAEDIAAIDKALRTRKT